MRYLLPIAIASTFLVSLGLTQDPDPAAWQSKLTYNPLSAYGPDALAETAVYAGYRQLTNCPREWGRGGYGKLVVTTLAYSGIRNTLGVGLDTALQPGPSVLSFRSQRVVATHEARDPRNHSDSQGLGR